MAVPEGSLSTSESYKNVDGKSGFFQTSFQYSHCSKHTIPAQQARIPREHWPSKQETGLSPTPAPDWKSTMLESVWPLATDACLKSGPSFKTTLRVSNSYTGDLSSMIFARRKKHQSHSQDKARKKPKDSKQRVRVHADFWRQRIQGLQLKSHLLNLAE